MFGRCCESLYGIFREGHDHLGTGRRSYLTARHDLVWIYGLQGRTDEAIELSEKVLEKKQQTFGQERRITFGTMNNLVTYYLDKGRTVDALSLHERVLNSRKRVLGEEHYDTKLSMRWIDHIHQLKK